jgi:hypothetical protein
MVRYCEADDCKEIAYWKNENDVFAKFCIEHKDDSMKSIKWCIHGKRKEYCKECRGSQICEHGKQKDRCKECGGSAFCEHGKQKDRCKECGGSQICEHGKQKRYCKECGGSAFCEHGKRKNRCKECGGSQICKHGKQKSNCKECGGSQICEHGKQKSNCKECGGSQICEHGKQKSNCKECGGSQICKHGKHKSYCKECRGSQICKHDKEKRYCKECGGSQICEHSKRKNICKECGGSAFCKHGKRKNICKECGGSQICEHSKRKNICKECGGSAFCEHSKRKDRCKECGGSALCKSEWCDTIKNNKYKGYCLRCFMYMFPEEPIARNYKTKEKEVVDRIKERFSKYDWVYDKRIQDGCSRRRPDMVLDMGEYLIIVEIDENQHEDYECSCENKRLMEISQDIGHRPIVFIRFNPDDYKDESGKNVTSCWGENKNGILVIKKNKKEEWENRINRLLEEIEYWIENKTEKTLEVIQLFYDLNLD